MEITRLPIPFKEFLDLLNQKQVEYLLVGVFAVNFYGYHRATGDMEIWIAVSAENSAKIVDAYQEFGLASLGLKPESFNREGVMLSIGAPPVKIEVMTSVDGVNFAECFQERFQKTFDGVQLNVISLDQLLKNKAATGRLKDKADVEELEKR